MAKISIYPLDSNPKLSDKLIGTSVGFNEIGNLENPTYNFSLQQLLDLFSPLLPGNTLQGVLDNNNTATEDINLFGTIYTTDLEVSNISNLFSVYISDSLYVEGSLFDRNNSQGSSGQILRSTGSGIEWFTPSNTIPTLQQVLTSGNEADVEIILTANITAEGINADTILVQDSFQLNGNFIDSDGLTGTSGQMLTSLGSTGVLWEDVPVYIASSPLSINPATRNITIQQANGTQNGYLSFADWISFDGKQNALSGTGIVVSSGGTISYVTNNSTNWNLAYNDSIVSASISGATTKTLTLTQRDGDTITASWQDTGADLSLTTLGTSGPATLVGGVLNVPNYTSGGSAVWGGITGILSNQTDLQNALDLKANNSNVVHRTGDESVLGVKSFTQTAINRSALEFDNNDPLYNSIKMYNRVANDAIEISNFSTGGGILINNTGGFASHGIYLANSGEGNALLINNVGTGTGNAGNGIYLINNDSGAMIRGMISSSGPGIVLESEISSTGTPIEHIKDGITNFKVSTIGDVTANKFIKSGGTSSQFLMADGSVNSGGFITSLTGEATATGPGAATVTLNNASVTAKVLTGLNITGGTVVSTDSILTGFGKLQNQVNGLIGGSTYQGVWDASTNTPALASSVGTNGYYYIVSVAGSTNLNGITDWNVGDWAIFHGTTWQKVDNTDAVSSVNGFTGAVSLTTSNISEGTNLYYTEARVNANANVAANTAARHNAVTIGTANGLSLSTQVLSLGLASTSANGALSSADWNTFNSKQSALTFSSPLVNTSGTISMPAATGSVNGYLTSANWTTFNSKQAALSGTGIVLSTGGTISYLTNNSTNWNTAYTNRITSLTTTGSGAATLVANVLNIPTPSIPAAIFTAGAGTCSTIRVGVSNTANGSCSGALSGCGNTASGNNSFIGGGEANTASAVNSSVLGGFCNITNARYSTIGGGHRNIIQSPTNECCSLGVTIGGGIGHNTSGGTFISSSGALTGAITCCNAGRFSTIGGGFRNCATGNYSTIGGGYCNTASNFDSIVGGGRSNTASGYVSTMLGGCGNTASGDFSLISGGRNNTASGYFSSILGGAGNTASYANSHIIGSGLTASTYNTTFVEGLSKTSGTFRISHPDPSKTQTHYLQHSFVESPTRGDNIYRFVVTTVNGVGTIQLPDYYKFLNEDDQVFITAKNSFGIAYGAVNEKQTEITVTSNIDGEYNVLLIATRKDVDALNGWRGTEIWK